MPIVECFMKHCFQVFPQMTSDIIFMSKLSKSLMANKKYKQKIMQLLLLSHRCPNRGVFKTFINRNYNNCFNNENNKLTASTFIINNQQLRRQRYNLFLIQFQKSQKKVNQIQATNVMTSHSLISKFISSRDQLNHFCSLC